MCKEHDPKNHTLAKGLTKLKADGVIDGRLYDWGEALRHRRNIGAHANDEDVTKQDATDVLDFTIAICEYVYTLSKKYDEFKDRERKRAARKKRSQGTASVAPPPRKKP